MFRCMDPCLKRSACLVFVDHSAQNTELESASSVGFGPNLLDVLRWITLNLGS